PCASLSGDLLPAKEFSPNGAYWFCVYGEEPVEDSAADGIVYVFTETDYSLRIQFDGYDARYAPQVYWINEKLLYFSAWWGRASGTYIVLDVEEEKIVAREMICDGSVPFQQAQEAIEESPAEAPVVDGAVTE
ncbi:MAG: hypothetical protein QG656_2285, partial [Candidatus Hydrogenedentes bacterium]|nr:hypothetical protein [Candidatus Hydrogenedentota bacterium]